MSELTIDQFTDTTTAGAGVFDEMMRSVKAHLEQEFAKNRIKGPEYSSVYLGALQSVMDHALRFLLEKEQAYWQAELLKQQVANAVTENEVLLKQICKLEAEFDVLMEQKLKTVQETALLTQKKVTEQAQTRGEGVDGNSVIGRQKTLYEKQAEGFLRDAEQKAAKLMVDTWNVRKTTAPNDTDHGDINSLGDAEIKSAVDKLLSGVNA